jgi:hypothetical protein
MGFADWAAANSATPNHMVAAGRSQNKQNRARYPAPGNGAGGNNGKRFGRLANTASPHLRILLRVGSWGGYTCPRVGR